MQEVAETKNKYLQESQIENVKSELESLPDNIDGFVRLLTMIESAAHQPDAFGLNCGIGPESMLNALEILLKQCRLR